MANDLTHKENNRHNKENELRLQLAISASNIGLWDYNLQSDKLFLSAEYYKIFGYEVNEFSPSIADFLTGIHADDIKKEILIKNILENTSDKPYIIHFRHLAKSGDYIWISLRGHIVAYNEKERPVRIAGTIRDISEAKSNELAIKENEELYRNLFELSPYPIVVHCEGKAVMINAAALKFLGASDKSEIIGKPVINNVSPEYQKIAAKRIEKLYKEGGFTDTIEEKFITLNGEVRDVEVLGSLITFRGKKSVQVIFNDITERKRAETLLKESEFMIRKTQQITKVGSYKADIKNRRLYFSEEAINILKCDPADFDFDADKILKILLHPKEIQILTAKYQQQVSRKDISEPFTLEGRIKHTYDKEKHINSLSKITVDKNGEPTTIIGSVQDVTELKLAEIALIQSEEKFRSFMETASNMMNIVDKDLRIIYANKALLETMEYSEKELTGMHVADLLSPESRKQYYTPEKHNELVTKGKVEYELTWFTKSGKRIDGELKIVAIYDKEGNFAGSRGIFNDITERKKANLELIKAKEKAEESDRLKSAFLANMSHEIHTPLNGILGFSQMLNDPEFSAEQKQEFVQIINKSANQLLNIINDILDISYIESHQVIVHNEQFNLNNLLNEICDFFKSSLFLEKPKSIEFISSYYFKDEDSLIISDAGKLQIIINNLIRNAFKFTNKGYIELGYKRKGSMLEFYIKDSGIGIPKEKLGIIFDRFRQVDETQTRQFGGTGLGLAISKGYIDILNGTIRVESERGKGSIFYFSISYHPAPSIAEKINTLYNNGTMTDVQM
ncbi:MAG: PAS domain S-box protein [Bacteroidia bacterium]|nr:PAS domain S-box protein [Bacteroidia bacterium]